MRARLDELIEQRQLVSSAIGGFTCYDFTTALGVVGAAEQLDRGVALLVSEKTAQTRDGLRLIAALRGLADDARVPVSVQLDHATDFDSILRGVEAGADAVLADGAHLPLEENAAFVARVREATHAAGIVVEAELGALAGNEDVAAAVEAVAKTDPVTVAPFLAASGAHILATAVGNVHGTYASPPELDWELIERVRSASLVPLSLHGASGIPDSDVRQAIRGGLGKVNINTELRSAVLTAAAGQLERSLDDVLSFERAWREAALKFALQAMLRLDGERLF